MSDANLPSDEVVYQLSNDELAQAIVDTHEMLKKTGTASSAHTPLLVHLNLLLKVQYQRACTARIKAA